MFISQKVSRQKLCHCHLQKIIYFEASSSTVFNACTSFFMQQYKLSVDQGTPYNRFVSAWNRQVTDLYFEAGSIPPVEDLSPVLKLEM